jgi:hypothetical protein
MMPSDLTTPEQPEEYNNILAQFKYAKKGETVYLTTRQIMILSKHTQHNAQQVNVTRLLLDIANQTAFGHPIKERK